MSNIDAIRNYIINEKTGKVKDDISFKDITTLKIGGKIHLVYYPNTISNLLKTMEKIELYKINWVIIGCGSNSLCSDERYEGVVIILNDLDILAYGSKESLYLFSQFKLSKLRRVFGSYYGFSKLSLIPGTIGGAVITNAGLYGFNISEIIEEVLVYDNGKLSWIKNDGTIFGYRNSIFRDKRIIILCVKIKLTKYKDDYLKWKGLKNKSQTVSGFNAGSTFKNPVGLSAWKLIDECAVIRKVGDCEISNNHANFLINKGYGKSDDMIKLIKNIQREVLEKKGILLELEWSLINFNDEF